MILNEEFLVKKLLPLIRKYIVFNCIKKGFRKTEIARRLGITSSALAKYGESNDINWISNEVWREIKNDISLITQYICSLGYNSMDLNKLILKYWMKWNSKGIFCEELFNLYKKYIFIYDKTEFCEMTMKSYGEILINSALVEVQEAFEIFRRIPYIINFIPEVSTNIIRLVEVGEKYENYPIIGFPGRIGIFKNRLFTYTPPKIGGSKHMSNILKKLYTLDNRIHGLTGIKYNEKLIQYIDKKVFSVNIYSSNSDQDLLMKIVESSDLIVDRGGIGREGFIYIAGIDSKEAVKKVEKILTKLDSLALME